MREWSHHEVSMSGTYLLRTSGLQSYRTNSGCSNREMQLQTRPRLLEVMHAPKRRQSLAARWSLSFAVDPDCQHCLQEGKVDGREILPLSICKL